MTIVARDIVEIAQKIEFETRLVNEEVDIRTYPDPITPLLNGQKVDLCVGDLHANPIKLVRFLIKHGVLNMSKEEYVELCKNYFVLSNIDQTKSRTQQISKGQFNKAKLGFFDIMDKATFNKNARIIIIGDEVQDRGFDYFMFYVYDKLLSAGVSVETNASNHGFEFLRSYESSNKLQPQLMNSSHARSTHLTKMMIGLGCLTLHQMVEMVERAYKPTLRAISYCIDEESNTLVYYAHAPVSLQSICQLAKKWGIEPVVDLTKEKLQAKEVADVIDAINAKYQQHVTEKTLHELVDPAILRAGYDCKAIDCEANPFEFILWNRDCENLSRPAKVNGLNIIYVHGHHREDYNANLPHIIGLDSDFGKVFCDPNFTKDSPTFVVSMKSAPENVLRQSSDVLKNDGALPALKKSCAELTFFGKENKAQGTISDTDVKQVDTLKHQ